MRTGTPKITIEVQNLENLVLQILQLLLEAAVAIHRDIIGRPKPLENLENAALQVSLASPGTIP